MKNLMTVVLLIPVASFGAVGMQQRGEAQQGAGMAMMQDCPMNVQGAELALADTSDGIALSLTTKSGNVDELRRRAELMANMYSGTDGASTTMPGMMIPGVVKYEAIPGGARLTLTPKDPAKLGEFRKQVRSHVERMKSEGSCSTMRGMMQGMMRGTSRPSNEQNPELKKEQSEADHNTHHPGGEAK